MNSGDLSIEIEKKEGKDSTKECVYGKPYT